MPSPELTPERERRRIMVDFDGVLCDHKPGKDPLLEAPVPGAIEFLREAIEVYDVWIFSSRFAVNWEKETKRVIKWLRQNGLEDEELEKIGLTCVKLPSRIYIDDRAFLFKGRFPTIEQIREFEPWNKG